MDFTTDLIGILAGCFNVATFIPQVYKTWKTKSANDVSIQMFIIATMNASIWTAYGIALAKPDWKIYAPNAIVSVLSITQIILKVRYDRVSKK
jgi:MtN3 and saliva related transmembrane protein